MPHLWIATATDEVPADGDHGPRWSRRLIDTTCAVGDATLVRAEAADGAPWVLLGPASVRVNGTPLATGIAVLCDRDELLIDGGRLYFSTEARPVVAPLPPHARPLCCPRCTVALAAGAAAVACPRCGIWHHESEERRCWSYAPVCASCDQATAFDAPYRFDPAVLG